MIESIPHPSLRACAAGLGVSFAALKRAVDVAQLKLDALRLGFSVVEPIITAGVDVCADGVNVAVARTVRVTYSCEYITCRCAAVLKDECACIRAVLDARYLEDEWGAALIEANRRNSNAEPPAPISVRIVGPRASGGYGVELHDAATNAQPYLESYPVGTLSAALRVAEHLLRGETVPLDYRGWC